MAGIRNKNTRPEMFIRSALHARGIRYVLHSKHLPGRPDLVFPRFRAAIFVHGCFWHGHECSLFRWPATRRDWWKRKIRGNQGRDERAIAALSEQGWRTMTIWECALRGKSPARLEAVIAQVVRWLRGGRRVATISAPRRNPK